VLERNYNSQQTEGNKRGQQGQKPTLYSVAELVLGFKTAGILHQPSLLLTTLKQLSSGQHTAPTNHQDKKNLPDQNPVSVLFLAVVFGITVELQTMIPLCVHYLLRYMCINFLGNRPQADGE
jgi:hypothetical protein